MKSGRTEDREVPMRSTRPMLLWALILLLAAGSAQTQKKPVSRKQRTRYPKGIHWHHDVKSALREALERNAPILVAFIRDKVKLCDITVARIYANKGTISLTRKFVCLVAARGKHDFKKGRGIDGRIKKVCSKFGCVSCAEHQRIEVWAFARFNKGGSIMTPLHVFLDPRGKELERFQSDLNTTNEEFHDCMNRILDIVGPGLDTVSFRRMTAELKQVDGYIREKKYKPALEKLLKISRSAGRSRVADQSRERLKKLDAAVIQELKEIDKLIASGDFKAARARTLVVKRTFEGLPSARVFTDRLKLLRGRTGGAAALAKKQLARAEARFKSGQYAAARDLYRKIVKRYRTTPAGASARKRLEAFRTDEKLKAALARCLAVRDCTTWMKRADALMKNGRKAMAKEYYSRIVTTYPDSKHAAEARKKLASL